MADLSAPTPYVEVQSLLDEDYPADIMRYYWKSLYLDSLGDKVIDRLIACASSRASAHSTIDVWHMGGAMSRVRAEESAFGGRHAPYLLNVEANWEDRNDDQANIGWTCNCIEAMQPFSDGSEYLNFPGFLEQGEETLRKTFGTRYERLVELKNTYDPSNLFQLNMNIKPTR
jgi:hypothetical protein